MSAAGDFRLLESDVEQFWRDGVVMLKGALDEHWQHEIALGIELNLAKPSPRCQDYGALGWAKTGESLFHDQLLVRDNPHYGRTLTQSPLGGIAARIMRSPTALAWYTTVFLRSAGTKQPTPWHQVSNSCSSLVFALWLMISLAGPTILVRGRPASD